MNHTPEQPRYFRNYNYIDLPHDRTIEPQSLWKETDGMMILVDDDEFVCISPYNADDFQEVQPEE
jgi:hypothetical protein